MTKLYWLGIEAKVLTTYLLPPLPTYKLLCSFASHLRKNITQDISRSFYARWGIVLWPSLEWKLLKNCENLSTYFSNYKQNLGFERFPLESKPYSKSSICQSYDQRTVKTKSCEKSPCFLSNHCYFTLWKIYPKLLTHLLTRQCSGSALEFLAVSIVC